MPGSIQVSVLDFKELPSSSNAVKISLGKVEYEAGDRGTFSFPLTNLRDNLIIKVQDSVGNEVSHSGVKTISIIEKGTWDDIFPMEGGGLIHMKLQFILSDEERNRIRLMRESAMKKKQKEIVNSKLQNAETAIPLAASLGRLEVSDVLTATSSQAFQRSTSISSFLTFRDDISLKTQESDYRLKDESIQSQTFPNATDRCEETSSSSMTDTKNKSPESKSNLEDQESEVSSTDFFRKNNKEAELKPSGTLVKLDKLNLAEQETEGHSTKDNTILQLHQAEVDSVKKKKESESKQNLEEKVTSFVKKTSKKITPTPFQETKVPERLQELATSRSIIAEKIKSFSRELEGERDNQGPPQKTCSIRKMISAFESSISQDQVPIKPMGMMKSYRLGTSRLLKDNAIKDSSEKSESSSRRLRNSFSTGDLQKNDLSVIKTGEQDGFENSFVESKTGIEKEKLHKDSTKPYEEDATVSGRMREEDKESDTKDTENISDENDGETGLLGDCVFEEKSHRENAVSSLPEIESDERSENSSPKSSNEEVSNRSIGQMVKIALVVGFGVLVLLFRQREYGKSKKKEDNLVLKTRVFLNKQGSIEERLRKIDVRRLS